MPHQPTSSLVSSPAALGRISSLPMDQRERQQSRPLLRTMGSMERHERVGSSSPSDARRRSTSTQSISRSASISRSKQNTPRISRAVQQHMPVKVQNVRRDDFSDSSSLISFGHTTPYFNTPTRQDSRNPSKSQDFKKSPSLREDSVRHSHQYEESYVEAKKAIDDLNRCLDGDKRISKLTVVCAEFDHWDEAKHNAELNYGGANVLALLLAITKDEDEIRMICAALEMVFRASESNVHASFLKVGASVVPWLLQVLEICEQQLLKHPDISILNITKTLAYFSRVSELRSGLARHEGMMEALARVSTAELTPDCRTCRMRLIANLANCDDNKVLIVRTSGVLESVLRIAALDPTESAREYSSITLMDLAACKDNQVAMAANDKLLGTLVKLIVTEVIPETREAAVTAIQNLAYCHENRVRLATFSSGVILEALKKNISSDKNDKSRRRAAGALTNLANEDTAEILGNYKGLLQTLALVSSKDTNGDVQERAVMALTKVAASITLNMACYQVLLDALVVASLSSYPNSISAVLRVKARVVENRQSMARHPGVLDTLADISQSEQFPISDRENAMKAIKHLTNENENCKIMCHKTILDALVAGVTMEGKGRDIAESAIVSLERLATDVSNREKMARHDGLLTAVAKMTEREAKLERGIKLDPTKEDPVSRKLLAKSLLMSLLVAMP